MIESISSIQTEEVARLRAAYKREKRRCGLTQTVLAERCGWKNPSTVSRKLNGLEPLSYETLTALCAALGVDPATISPRLVSEATSDLVPVFSRMLTVSDVSYTSKSSWTDSRSSLFMLPFHTADEAAYAISFADAAAPAGLEGWVVVVEPNGKIGDGDFVILHGVGGAHSYGRMLSSQSSSCSIEISGKGKVMAKLKSCSLVASLVRKTALTKVQA